MEEETQGWVQGGGYKPPPKKPQLVNEPLPLELVHEPPKRYGPFPAVWSFEVSTVPIHDALPANPLNVVPFTSAPVMFPLPFTLSVKVPETLPLLSIVTVHVPLLFPL
jgi:hypothetical protein